MSRTQLAASLFLLSLMATGPYLGGLSYPFIYDDLGQIVENSFLQNPSNLKQVISFRTVREAQIINGRRPMVLLTYFTDLGCWGLSPGGFRLTNLLWHTGVTWLIYFLLRKLAMSTGSKQGVNFLAFLGAGLFAIHPMIIEAVHAPSFRPDLLCTLFMLLYLVLSTSSPDSKQHPRTRIVFSMLALMGAVTSKENGVVAPALLAGTWWLFPSTRLPRNQTVTLMALSGLLVAGYLAFALWPGGAPVQALNHPWNGRSLVWPANLLSIPWLAMSYLRIWLWPHPLILDRVLVPVTSPGDWRLITGLVLAVAIVVTAFRFRSPWLRWSLVWSGLCFLPVSNLVPLMNPMAERYAYSIILGPSVLLACGLSSTWFTQKTRIWLRNLILAMLCVIWITVTLNRLNDWKDSATLWARTLADEPRSDRAWLWSGLELKHQGRLEEARQSFHRSHNLNPHDPSAKINLAILTGRDGRFQEAEQMLQDILRETPSSLSARLNLAVAQLALGKEQDYQDTLQSILRSRPWNLKARHWLVDHKMNSLKYDEARDEVEELLRMAPRNKEAQKKKQLLDKILSGE